MSGITFNTLKFDLVAFKSTPLAVKHLQEFAIIEHIERHGAICREGLKFERVDGKYQFEGMYPTPFNGEGTQKFEASYVNEQCQAIIDEVLSLAV